MAPEKQLAWDEWNASALVAACISLVQNLGRWGACEMQIDARERELR